MTHQLAPGEVCIYCGTVGAIPPPKPKRVPKKKPVCAICSQPFTRQTFDHNGTPWRLYRRKRVHIACIPKLP